MQKLFLVGTYRTMLLSPLRPETDLDWKSKYRSLYWSSNKLLVQVLLCIPGSWGNLFSSSFVMITGPGFYPLPLPPHIILNLQELEDLCIFHSDFLVADILHLLEYSLDLYL